MPQPIVLIQDASQPSRTPPRKDTTGRVRMNDNARQISRGERFRFGENWAQFLELLTEDRIRAAEESLKAMLGSAIAGRSFLDIGCGSGLFSLAARRLGARVRSFDFDPQSVACARELKSRYFKDDSDWIIDEGSVLDRAYLDRLGRFDLVYAWGVLHHTGRMWEALESVLPLVGPGGQLYIAIYNDQGRASGRWLEVKRMYNALPPAMRWLVLLPAAVRVWGPTCLRSLGGMRARAVWKGYAARGRGMSPWHDLIDWVGGYPFEVAKPEEVFRFCRDRGLTLAELRTCAGGIGCNEYVFRARRD
jgi:2-polyprenyl-6-hydroxyphenyl methylase/3-demethylubiquinone-9 3-methyltransferase